MRAVLRKDDAGDLRIVSRCEEHEETVIAHVHAGARRLGFALERHEL